MNPIVHAELSWLLAQTARQRRDRVLVVACGLAPDLDGLSVLAGPHAFGTYHHLLCHGVLAGLACTVLAAACARERARTAVAAITAFHLHLLCDLAGSGPNWSIYYWWPFSGAEWFWDGQWEFVSWQNSLIGLVATLLCLLAALPLGRTIFELVSLRLDHAVATAIRGRFPAPPEPG